MGNFFWVKYRNKAANLAYDYFKFGGFFFFLIRAFINTAN